MVHPIGPRDPFAGCEALTGFVLLMRVEFGLSTKSGAALARSGSTFVGSLQNTRALLLSEAWTAKPRSLDRTAS